MNKNAKSRLPVRVQQTKTMPRYNKTHMLYLATIMVVLNGVIIATSF